MMQIVFLNHASMGHVNTLLTIALQMKADGYSVRFLIPGIEATPKVQILQTSGNVASKVRSHNISVELLPPPISQLPYALLLPQSQGYREIQVALNLFSAGLGSLTQAIIKKLEKIRPEAVVTDFAFFGAAIAAEALNIPCIVIYHSGLPFKGEQIPPFGSGLPIGAGAYHDAWTLKEQKTLAALNKKVNKVRRKLGLPPLKGCVLREPYSPWLNLITSHEGIEPPRDNLGRNTFFIGTCFAQPGKAVGGFPNALLATDKYKVYVSLGTIFNNRPAVFEKIIAGLARDDFQVIVSAGGAYDALNNKKLPDNVLLFQTVPQVELLPRVDLVIGHGGNNSTNETLAAGKPLIVLPVGGEQGDNASRIEFLQAGLRGDINCFTSQEILDKVNQIRNNPLYREKAVYYSSLLGQTNGADTASRLTAWVAQHRKPLFRPDAFPLTLTPDQVPPLLVANQD